jgi:hypothetical protein
LAQDFLQEQDFPRSNLITADQMGKKLVFRGTNCPSVVLELRRSIPFRTPNSELRWGSLCGKGTPERSSYGVLEARRIKFLSGKSCSLRKS